ncbi:hypothetical protein BKA62DRAFT_345778 [Auriculariales sp. MPI-PUGE-AT-0066]|nr:hypothetical protein BKA62DRAFT_345778 [Auriculariales sp. MPI-PUGE-AT-0066]
MTFEDDNYETIPETSSPRSSLAELGTSFTTPNLVPTPSSSSSPTPQAPAVIPASKPSARSSVSRTRYFLSHIQLPRLPATQEWARPLLSRKRKRTPLSYEGGLETEVRPSKRPKRMYSRRPNIGQMLSDEVTISRDHSSQDEFDINKNSRRRNPVPARSLRHRSPSFDASEDEDYAPDVPAERGPSRLVRRPTRSRAHILQVRSPTDGDDSLDEMLLQRRPPSLARQPSQSLRRKRASSSHDAGEIIDLTRASMSTTASPSPRLSPQVITLDHSDDDETSALAHADATANSPRPSRPLRPSPYPENRPEPSSSQPAAVQRTRPMMKTSAHIPTFGPKSAQNKKLIKRIYQDKRKSQTRSVNVAGKCCHQCRSSNNKYSRFPCSFADCSKVYCQTCLAYRCASALSWRLRSLLTSSFHSGYSASTASVRMPSFTSRLPNLCAMVTTSLISSRNQVQLYRSTNPRTDGMPSLSRIVQLQYLPHQAQPRLAHRSACRNHYLTPSRQWHSVCSRAFAYYRRSGGRARCT